MEEIARVFLSIAEKYGASAALGTLFVSGLLLGVYKVVHNSSAAITKYLETKLLEPSEEHKKAIIHRKNITPEVREMLSELAKEADADRTLLFEYSNGSSNLVGLPFLYITATCEVVHSGTNPVSGNYQRLNTALFAEFLEDLEDKGLLFYENIDAIKDTYPALYQMLRQDGTHSVLFYSLSGMDNTIGFLMVSTTDDSILTRKDSIPKATCVAQRITSLINYNIISDSRV